MPVAKKLKKGKKVRRPKGNRVATAPTRDVIINISTARPRASKTLKPAVPKRSEDLGGRIKDFEVSQSQFRQTQMIKEQAIKMGLIDKRLSVLTNVVDNEQTKPLFQKPPPKTKKEEPAVEYRIVPPPDKEQPPGEEEGMERMERLREEEAKKGKDEGMERMERLREEEAKKGKPRGRPPLSEEEKQARKESRELATLESKKLLVSGGGAEE